MPSGGNNTPNGGSDVPVDDSNSDVDNTLVRRVKILRIQTSKLKEAYKSINYDLTRKLLLDVELETSESELASSETSENQLGDNDYDFISSILSSSKDVVDSVNRAISFASGLASNNAGSANNNSEDISEANNCEFDDIKLCCKPFTFDGEIKVWREFWDCFSVQIHSRRLLSKITKFTFLLECLRGKALELVKISLTVTEANYDAAIKRLKDQYGNPERLVSADYDELQEIVSSDDASSQRANYDVIKKILQNLESVGI